MMKAYLVLPLSEAVDLMRGKPGQSVKITIARNNDEKIELNLKREIIKRQIVSYSIKEGLAYVRISQFNENAYRELSVAISSLRKRNVIRNTRFNIRSSR